MSTRTRIGGCWPTIYACSGLICVELGAVGLVLLVSSANMRGLAFFLVKKEAKKLLPEAKLLIVNLPFIGDFIPKPLGSLRSLVIVCEIGLLAKKY